MGLAPERDDSERQAVELLMSALRAGGSTNVDPTTNQLRVPTFEFLRVMQAQEFLRGEAGRYWVALSLREAESLRGAIHAAMDADKALIEGKAAAVGLRIGDLLLDSIGPSQLDGSAAPYAPPPRQQLHSAVQALRLIDTQHAFNSYQCRLLLRMLRLDACEDRRRWVNDTASCRRRPQAKIEQLRGTGLPTVLKVEDEYHLLVQSATVWRIAHEMNRRQLGRPPQRHACTPQLASPTKPTPTRAPLHATHMVSGSRLVAQGHTISSTPSTRRATDCSRAVNSARGSRGSGCQWLRPICTLW